jgi:heme a synthase
MFLVLVMGATVTTTGSAQGCGRHWPLCGGTFVPDFALAALIEFSHRAVTGVEGLLVVALTVAVLALYRDQRPILVLAPLMLGFLLLQAGLGAWAVMAPQSPAALAAHFGVSLIALASTALTALYVRRPGALLDAPAVGRTARVVTWGMAAYLYGLTYTGAYVRHVGAAAACQSWPLCGSGGRLGPDAVAVNLAHRGAAGGALVLAVALLLLFRRSEPGRRDLAAGAAALVGLLVAQAAAGAFLVTSGFGVSSELLHAALAGLAFTAAAYLCLGVSLGRRAEAAAAGVPPPRLRTEGVP